MSKILIAWYMGFLAGLGRDAQRPNFGNQYGTQGRCGLDEYDPLPDLNVAPIAGDSFADKKHQKGNQTATDYIRIRSSAKK